MNTLNGRIKNFCYGSENVNKPPEIKLEKLISKPDLTMSAAEILTFVRYFGLMMGDLIPRSDEHYELYISLREVSDILFAPYVTTYDSNSLVEKIKNVHDLYKQFYGKLKPKMHFLTHYPRNLLNNGPPTNFWGMRFESSHRSIKANALASKNTRNLLKTIATKQAFKMCKMMHSLQYEKTIEYNNQVFNNNKTYFSDAARNQMCSYYRKVLIHGLTYKINMCVVLRSEEIEFRFGRIIDIVSCGDDLFFYLEVLEEFSFDRHMYAYIVHNRGEKELVNFADLPNLPPVTCIKKMKQRMYVLLLVCNPFEHL